MYGEMGKSSNTMLFNDRPADVNALIAQASGPNRDFASLPLTADAIKGV